MKKKLLYDTVYTKFDRAIDEKYRQHLSPKSAGHDTTKQFRKK